MFVRVNPGAINPLKDISMLQSIRNVIQLSLVFVGMPRSLTTVVSQPYTRAGAHQYDDVSMYPVGPALQTNPLMLSSS